MSWPFETSESFVTPEHAVEAQRLRLGVSPDAWALPPTLVLTFQRVAYEHLLERVEIAPEGRDQAGTVVRADQLVGVVDDVSMAVARSGIGAPAAAVILEHAIARGVKNILVAGAAGSLQPDLPVGSTIIVESAEREDGTSHHYLPAGEVVAADEVLCTALEQCAIARGAAPVRGRSWTIDAPYRETVNAIRRHRQAGVAVVEMEGAAIFAVARVRAVRAALIVAVSDELFSQRWINRFHDTIFLQTLTRATDAAVDAAVQLTG